MILLIDNYDSFTYNLYDYLLQLDEEVVVFRNDQLSIEQTVSLQPKAIVISPGPHTPAEAGITNQLINYFHQHIPILGICLGFQAIGQFFGAHLVKCPYPMHGKVSDIFHSHDTLFHNIPNPFPAMRYHSLCLKDIDHRCLLTIASTTDGLPMAIRHRHYPICGFQFHPESILTPHGMQLLINWKNQFLNLHYSTPQSTVKCQ